MENSEKNGQVQKTLAALSKNGFEVYSVQTSEEAVKKALELIPDWSVVGWGGSMSIIDSGLIEALKKGNYQLLDRDTAKSSEERTEIMRQCLTADYFLCSFNALTEDGTAVNTDGNGNRVAAISFGPKNVIAIVGVNKIVKNMDEAYDRIKRIAAPLNCKRFGLDPTPENVDYLCNVTQILRRTKNGRIKVILVNEDLGY